jgi:tRNA G18 (ribose-2'-O)-methylase SpoU
MSHPKVATTPNISLDSLKHIEAIAKGKDLYSSWQYNVQDHLKSKSQQEIKQHLKDTAFPYAVLFENFTANINIATAMRNANAFNAKEIFYLGVRRYDKRGCQGTGHYNDIQWLSTVDELLKLKERYTFVGVDNIEGSVSISDFKYKDNTLLIFGEEGAGLTPMMQSLCENIVHINQFGSVRSINVGSASAIICYDFVNKHQGK